MQYSIYNIISFLILSAFANSLDAQTISIADQWDEILMAQVTIADGMTAAMMLVVILMRMMCFSSTI